MENTTHEHGKECCNNWCNMGHKYHLLRWVLGIFILVMTFTIGYKLGEFKGNFGGDGFGSRHGYGMMRNRLGSFNKSYGPGMMSGGSVFIKDGNVSGTVNRTGAPMMFWQQTLPTSTPQK